MSSAAHYRISNLDNPDWDVRFHFQDVEEPTEVIREVLKSLPVKCTKINASSLKKNIDSSLDGLSSAMTALKLGNGLLTDIYIHQPDLINPVFINTLRRGQNALKNVSVALKGAKVAVMIYEDGGLTKESTIKIAGMCGAEIGSRIGGVLGSYLSPGVGTAVGGILGGLIGSLFARGIAEFTIDLFSRPVGHIDIGHESDNKKNENKEETKERETNSLWPSVALFALEASTLLSLLILESQ